MTEPSGTFVCPITHELMVDPVIDPDGNSYERRAIEDWLRQNGTSPITRAPLLAADLRPNRALKAAIDEYRHSIDSNNQLTTLSLTELKPYELTVNGNYVDGFVHISIQPPSDTNRSPCDICCVIDTSGSMAVQSEIQSETNEKFGLSRLDLVKHAIKTIVHSLQPQDRLSLVSFANSATVLFQLTHMSPDGKSSALAALERLEDNGQTNLWDGLRAGLEVLLKGQRAVGSNAALFLLTDGCPNVEPPRGHIPTLEKLKQKTNFTCMINTFGFGYDLDSQLLEEIAMIGNSGSYAFIPDGSFVGTIFVNAMTTLLATVATNVQVHVHGSRIEPSDYTRWYTTVVTDQNTVFDLGLITYGQSKDLLIPISSESFSKYEFSVIYNTLQEPKRSIKLKINTNPEQNDIRRFVQQKFRLQLVHCVRTVLQAMRQQPNEDSAVAMNQIKELEEKMRKYSDGTDAFVKDLLADLTGQVQEALTNKDWFKKWGVHFLPSLTRAHLLQYCNNFKDPGVQHYGCGTLFSTIRDEMDTIFCSLPAPKPSQQTGATIDMTVFHNADGGCFHGGCLVRLMNGTTKLIKNVKPGDRMAPHGGMVNYVVKTKCQNKTAKMVIINNGLIITAWHPIRLDQQWIMPCSLVSGPTEISCEEVYNFALDQGHTVVVNDIECVTLGHGFKEDVVRHNYYGTQRVIDDLRQLDFEQNNSGIIEVTEEVLIRNKHSGLVTGLRLIDAQHQSQIIV
ncbi:unnamed protein product [Rotaria magnacalcarata]|uniref:Uncharacterized protein n=2 Tax=Rotaria magnacalcarata TaxID=392030 RepID=A0A815BNF3_9BILA|nr:unnamed protein product [Rotaria magnacalcarata]CAF1274050.1 unnamed protein product [Rotaria magnacalcarata]CAF2048458.1 unnamed protein product [Rotaria magnacalcarata]CAF3879205.1 unnamed protein product [Rotaria magnacalcarata]CAF4024129.1 unnamed protein product [Rotaria magnacalcarata]